MEQSTTTSKQETIVQGYRGSHDHDVIVFQGTLYETFEYRILSAPDPSAVGTLLTLDLPIDANTYKWTVDYYNAQVDDADRISADLRPHTPGDLASYPSRAELQALIADEQHWDMPGSRAVGQGTASDFQSVSFETAQATEEQRTITRSYGGGARFGVNVSVDTTNSEGATHGVFYAEETSFEASVGDIANPADYAQWQYDWGFSIHTVNRRSDDYGPRKHSFQYLRFWAEPK